MSENEQLAANYKKIFDDIYNMKQSTADWEIERESLARSKRDATMDSIMCRFCNTHKRGDRHLSADGNSVWCPERKEVEIAVYWKDSDVLKYSKYIRPKTSPLEALFNEETLKLENALIHSDVATFAPHLKTLIAYLYNKTNRLLFNFEIMDLGSLLSYKLGDDKKVDATLADKSLLVFDFKTQPYANKALENYFMELLNRREQQSRATWIITANLPCRSHVLEAESLARINTFRVVKLGFEAKPTESKVPAHVQRDNAYTAPKSKK